MRTTPVRRKNITKEEHDYIVKYKDKKSIKQIAMNLDRHKFVIWQYLQRTEQNGFIYTRPYSSRNVPFNTWQEYEKVVNLFLHSVDNREETIAKKTGLHKQTVTKIINEYFDKTWA